MIVYKATIEIAVVADCEGEACDGISNMLDNDFVYDWSYQGIAAMLDDRPVICYLSPRPTLVIDEDYMEGDLFPIH